MLDPRKNRKPPANLTYTIDGASYGLDDRLVDAVKGSIEKKLTTKTLEVPRLPQVATRILQLANNPNTGADDIVRAIVTDPLLVTRILHVANSAAYNTGQPVSALQPAIMRLGSKFVEDVVFSESIRLKVFQARAYRTILQESWQLSLATAVACEAMSKATGIERESAFLMGLLHDTGKPVLASVIAELEKQNQNRPLGEDTVMILMSQLHEDIGAHVLETWEMTPQIVEAARGHHLYRPGKATPSQQLVHAGNLVCQHLGIGDTQREINFTVEHAFADLGLNDNERMEGILETVKHELEGLMVGLDDGTGHAKAA